MSNHGNDYERQRHRIEDRIIKAIDNSNPSNQEQAQQSQWPPTLWACLTVKYLHDPRNRVTLGKLGILAGYEVT